MKLRLIMLFCICFISINTSTASRLGARINNTIVNRASTTHPPIFKHALTTVNHTYNPYTHTLYTRTITGDYAPTHIRPATKPQSNIELALEVGEAASKLRIDAEELTKACLALIESLKKSPNQQHPGFNANYENITSAGHAIKRAEQATRDLIAIQYPENTATSSKDCIEWPFGPTRTYKKKQS